MTRADRLNALLKNMKSKEQEVLLHAWKNIFGVSDIIEVYEMLIYVKKEINAFKQDLEELNLQDNTQFKKTIETLNFIIEFPSMAGKLENQPLIKNDVINVTFASFEMFKSFSDAQHISTVIEDDIPDDEFVFFKESLQNIIKDIRTSNVPESDKDIFLSIFIEFEKAMSLYQVNGINIFTEAIRNNFCKIKMIEESEVGVNNSDVEWFKRFTKITIGKIFIWTQKYVYKKAYSVLENEAIKFLESKASEWSELPMLENKDNNSDEGIEAEIVDD